jgi:hypothetical protein
MFDGSSLRGLGATHHGIQQRRNRSVSEAATAHAELEAAFGRLGARECDYRSCSAELTIL